MSHKLMLAKYSRLETLCLELVTCEKQVTQSSDAITVGVVCDVNLGK